MDRTLNQIINSIKDICSRHHMIKNYDFGSDVMAIDTKQIEMPYVYISPQTSTIQKWGVQLNIMLVCMDQLTEKPDTTEQEILSDTLQILQDIVTKLDDIDTYDFQIVIEDSFTVNPFTHRFDSDCAGWWVTIKIQVAYPMGLCDVPITNPNS